MNTKGLFFLVLFRTSSFFTQNKILKLIGIPIRIFYKIIINYILGIDIHDETIIGNNFQVYHGQGLIIHKDTIIAEKYYRGYSSD